MRVGLRVPPLSPLGGEPSLGLYVAFAKHFIAV